MRIEQLEYFVSVATHASFTKAAEECHVAQPAISTQIKALEQELGFKLFTRGPQGATLTEPGAMYFDVAKSLLKTMANAAQRGRSIAQGFSGDLSFGVFGRDLAAGFHGIKPLQRSRGRRG